MLDAARLREAEALIFDIDGTLWDSTAVVAKAWNKALSDCAEEVFFSKADCPVLTAERLRAEFGKPMDEIARSILPPSAWEALCSVPGRLSRFLEACYAREDEAIAREGGVLYPNVPETLQVLSARYPLYAVSNCQCGYIESFTAYIGMPDIFRGQLCFGDTGLSKGETMALLMRREGLREVVYIGDIEGDAIASAKAGAAFIWASYGFGTVPKALYTKKISEFAELSYFFTGNSRHYLLK